MRPVLFSPHNDDETLFASFLIQRYEPLVVTVFKSVVQEAQGITAREREWETSHAVSVLSADVGLVQWPFPDDGSVHVEEIKDAMRDLIIDEYGGEPPPVFVPAWSKRGHRDHNMVNVAALEVFADVVEYMTYDYPEYDQLYPPYDSQVSIIDLLFMQGPGAGDCIWRAAS